MEIVLVIFDIHFQLMEEQHTELFRDFLAWKDSPCQMDEYATSYIGRIETRVSGDIPSSQRKPNYPTSEYEYFTSATPTTIMNTNLFNHFLDTTHISPSPHHFDKQLPSNKETYCLLQRKKSSSSVGACNNNYTTTVSSGTLTGLDIPKMAKQRHGCQYLLHQLQQQGSSPLGQEIVETCYRHFGIWMKHPIANFLCQQVWKYMSDQQREDIFKNYSEMLPRAALHTYSTRVVQVMISTASQRQDSENRCKSYLKAILSTVGKSLFKDVNGAHVLQHCFLYWSSEDNEFLYNMIQENFLELATHRQGCCMIQTSMDFANASQLDNIAKSIMEHILELIHDAFGNYVVQRILDNKYTSFLHDMMKKLRGHWYEMSMEKFSSNITEKCLQLADETQRWEMIQEIAKDSSNIGNLLHDAYGNYVIQRMLQVASPPQKLQLKEWIEKYWNTLRHSRHGRQIQYNLEKLMING